MFAKVKTHLLDERQGAEWEVIDQEDDVFAENQDRIGTKAQDASGNGTPIGKAVAASPGSSEDMGKVKGGNGWTKLKSRNGETEKANR